MKHIDEITLLRIKQIPISQVSEQLGIIVKKKKAFCYNGHDTDASLQINDKNGLFHCFGCGDKGDVIGLVMNVNKIGFLESCKWLMQHFNIYDDSYSLYKKKLQKEPLQTTEDITDNYSQNPDIYEWLIQHLNLSQVALNYLITKRGFSENLVKQLEIKDISNPQITYKALKQQWGDKALLSCGLNRIDENGNIKFTWWDHVIIFPFTDLNFRINYLQGRMLNGSKIRYVNLSNIKPSIYNLNILQNLAPQENLLLCEGIPDTITALAMGYKAIGILGADNFNTEYIRLLINYNLYVVPDADQGGQHFIDNLKKAFGAHGKTVNVFRVPKGYNDLNEFFVNKNR